VAARQNSLQLKQSLYDAGLSDATDVIEAHNSVFSISNDLKSQLYDYWKLRLNLMYVAGYSADQLISDVAQALVD
jgi:outer membrane protein TolC